MSSSVASRIGSQTPRVHVAPRADRTFGDLAADFAAQFGLDPDPWQRLILDDWLAERAGQWAALTCGLAVPRQNGKNGVLEVRELFGMVWRGEKFLHTAHEVKTAKKHFRRLMHFFGTQPNDPAAKFPELNHLVAEVRKVNGEEAIILTNGGSVEMAARSKSSGRGFTVDVVVYDEAQQLDDDALEALQSTNSSAPTGNPQWIYTGTPPGPNAQGDVFTRVRGSATAASAKGYAWHEWSLAGRVGKAADELDLDDPTLWYETNPALGGRLQLSVVRGERGSLSDGGFGRERCGMWAGDNPDLSRVIDSLAWDFAGTGVGPAGEPSSYGLDMSHDRIVSIGVCVKGDKDHVEVAALDLVNDTLGVVEWLAERAPKKSKVPVVIDSMSPAASMIQALRDKGVRVEVTTATDMAKACGGFLDAVMQQRLTHFPQDPVDDALAGARKRAIGSAGGWGWDRKDSSVNIAPLVSITLAHYGAQLPGKRQRNGGSAFY